MTKRLRSILSVVLAMAMIFAMATTAFATETTKAPGLYVNGVKQNVTINAGDTVYDVVNRTGKAVWTQGTADPDYSPLPDGSQVQILTSFDGTASAPYNSDVLDAYEYYDETCTDPILAEANQKLLTEFPDSLGLGLWGGDGYGYSNDGPYMVYVGYDWTYEVNGARPGIAITPDATHPYDFFEYYMNEAAVDADDVIELTYSYHCMAFEY